MEELGSPVLQLESHREFVISNLLNTATVYLVIYYCPSVMVTCD